MYKTGHAACVPQQSQGCRRTARASDLRVVRTGPVIVNHAIDEWRRRLSACVDAEGGHFEHYL